MRPRKGSALSRNLLGPGWYEREFTAMLVAVNPNQPTVVGLARRVAALPHALVGAHARNAYIHEARATVDIDLVLPRWHAQRLVTHALRAYPNLSRRDSRRGAVISLRAGVWRVADVIVAEESPLAGAALATARPMQVPGLRRLRVPPIEVLVALKLDRAADPSRDIPRAAQDRADAAALMVQPHDPAAVRAALRLTPRRVLRYYEAMIEELWGGAAPGETLTRS